jgi:hypothetical protein
MYKEPKYNFHENLYDNDYPIVKLIEGMKSKDFKKEYNKKYFANTGMDNVVKDYFYGIYWLFQNYFNQDYKFDKFWFYKYEKAPLLSTIIEKKWHVVDKVEDNCEIKETLLNEYRVEQSNNFDFDEHLLFIIPNLEYQGYKYTMNEDVLSRLTEKMAKIDLDFYPDLKLSVDELDDKINNNSIDQNVIDCTNAPYFSKCYLKILNEKKKTDANTFLKKINVNVEYNDEEYDDDVYGGGAKKDKEKYFSKYIKYKSKYLNLKNNKK